MRLLKLVFTNVNSLSGRHSINFEDRAFTDHGIFTITGPTGSGKSSILDAVSLALFGRTPREAQAGVGAAECIELTKGRDVIESVVEFSVEGVRYSSSWKRTTARRSRRLSPAQVELRNLDSGELIASAKREWDAGITEITGMTFETFTRTMLLAQGAFAEFLKSGVDKRSQILERATGTELYTKIGVRIGERKKEADDAAALLSSKAEGVSILSGEQRAALALRLEEVDREIQGSMKSLEAARSQLSVADEKRGLVRRRRELERRSEDLRSRLAELAPEVEKAERGNKLRNLVEAKKTALEESRRAGGLQDELEAALEQKKGAEEALGRAQSGLDAAQRGRALLEEQEKELKRRRDEQQSRQKEISGAEKTNSSLEDSLARAKLQSESRSRELDEERSRLKSVRERIENLRLRLKSESLSAEEIDALNDASRSFEAASRFDFSGLAARIEEVRVASRKAAERAGERKREASAAGEKLEEARRRAASLQQAVRECANPDASAALRKAAAGVVVKTAEPVLLSAARALSGRPEAEEIRALLDSWKEFDGTREGYEAAVEMLESNEDELARRRSSLEALNSEVNALALECSQLQKNVEYECRLHADAEEQAARLEGEHAEGKRKLDEAWRRLASTLRLPEDECTPSLRARAEVMVLERTRAAAERMRDEEDLAAALKQEADSESRCRRIEKEAEDLREYSSGLAAQKTNLAERISSLSELLREKFAGEDYGRLHAEAEKKLEEAARLERSELSGKFSAAQDLSRISGHAEALAGRLREQRLRAEEALARLEDLLERAGESDVDESAELYSAEQAEAVLKEASQLEAQAKSASMEAEEIQGRLEKLSCVDVDEEEIRASIARLEESVGVLNQEKGRLCEAAAADDENRRIYGEIARELEEKKRVAALWTELYEKIAGRRDGEAFRKATQKYTFSLLLASANKIMSKINPRYTLCASGPDMLDLEVHDVAYGVRRTADNLSGGETFVVSLALALALSSMSSAKRRIDTLFLDEGFGSLDEDTLHAVLGTLDKLHKGSGRLIGLISHVPQVKERISDAGGAQIRVERIRNSGESRLCGDGVSWREDASRK